MHLAADGEPAGVATVAGRDEWVAQVEKLLAAYREMGVATAQILELRTIEVGTRVEPAAVRWQLSDVAGETIYEFRGSYTLADVGDGLRIVALAHNELPQLRARIARLRSR